MYLGHLGRLPGGRSRLEKPSLLHHALPGEESTWQCRRCKTCRFDLWVRKIPWSRKWQLIPVFLPGKFHGQRSLAGYCPWGYKELDMTEILNMHIHCHPHSTLCYRFKVKHTTQCESLILKASLLHLPRRLIIPCPTTNAISTKEYPKHPA